MEAEALDGREITEARTKGAAGEMVRGSYSLKTEPTEFAADYGPS